MSEEKSCRTCWRWVPRDFYMEYGDECGWWCNAVGARVDWYKDGYMLCRGDKWEEAMAEHAAAMARCAWEPVRTCRWELAKHGTVYDVYVCSSCGYEYAEPVTDGGVLVSIGDANYCPGCGAKVVDE